MRKMELGTTYIPEMVKRVARALALCSGARMVGPGQSAATRDFGWRGDGESLDKYVEAHWIEHVHEAGFAIEAMREPTEAMKSEPTWYDGDQKFTPGDAEAVWEQMIDAALK